MTFNAWRDPWVPVLDQDGSPDTLSLRGLYSGAAHYCDLGRSLTPLDREALHRFLPAVGATVVRGTPPRTLDTRATDGTFPHEAIDRFEQEFADRFNLAGDRPFLQRWDKTQADVDALADAKKGLARVLHPMHQLHPHEPGDSSAQWGVRRDARDATDPAVLTVLLVTSWFHNRDGNAKDAWGGKACKGSTATWTVNPMSVFLLDRTNLGRSIYANMPTEWARPDAAPMFLDHDAVPGDFITDARCLYRSTYARNVPLVYWDEGRPAGFVVGPMDYPVPALAETAQESLKAVHLDDHAVLVVNKKTKAGTDPTPRSSLGVRVTSTEGFERWFRADNGIAGTDGGLARWLQAPRTLIPDPRLAGWDIAVFNAQCDTYGGRKWADWSVLPGRAAGADPQLAATMQDLGSFASECRRKMLPPARIASGDSKVPAFLDTTQAAFFAAVEPVLASATHELAAGGSADVWALLNEIADHARTAFTAGTEPLKQHSLSGIASARSYYARALRALLAVSPHRPQPNSESGPAA